VIEKEFDSIEKTDIDALVANAVSEGRTIEYKERLPGGSDEDTREFLADVSSLSNAGGGDLIYGVREQRDAQRQPTGIPEVAEGLGGINVDAEKGRLENKLRDGIDPRIPGIRLRHIDGFPSGPIIVLRIPKSWASPHMVKFKNLSRFYSRTSAGKYQLDVREIRAAFLGSESVTERMSAFRSERVGRVLTGETPAPLQGGPKLVFHSLPIRGFAEGETIDMKAAESLWSKANVKPMGRPPQFGPAQFNFEGLLCVGNRGEVAIGYIQLFRNGAVEAVCARITDSEIVYGVTFEQELMREARAYLGLQHLLGYGTPLFVAISLVSAKGFTILPNEPNFHDHWGHVRRIDHEVLLAQEVLVEEEQADLGRLLRPALDTIWQASGWAGSQGYDATGKWVGYSINR
jgi:hypothetical protein